jgi:hypothetical protein
MWSSMHASITALQIYTNQHVKGWLTTLETPWILPFLMPKIAVLIHWGHKK